MDLKQCSDGDPDFFTCNSCNEKKSFTEFPSIKKVCRICIQKKADKNPSIYINEIIKKIMDRISYNLSNRSSCSSFDITPTDVISKYYEQKERCLVCNEKMTLVLVRSEVMRDLYPNNLVIRLLNKNKAYSTSNFDLVCIEHVEPDECPGFLKICDSKKRKREPEEENQSPVSQETNDQQFSQETNDQPSPVENWLLVPQGTNVQPSPAENWLLNYWFPQETNNQPSPADNWLLGLPGIIESSTENNSQIFEQEEDGSQSGVWTSTFFGNSDEDFDQQLQQLKNGGVGVHWDPVFDRF
ncbi:MAG: hypothetical protein Satyrvirus2_70 [Satyrvirus sp.]|uniref:Uncharacterized protein n=1 Tax=Satyrvirus sp. TaxID=2487771 RepID=A0A3G5AI22_9VIRU|nr:MAG: hypothetical protein Satyrvirus2_70 [Satyrvirus sp.]